MGEPLSRRHDPTNQLDSGVERQWSVEDNRKGSTDPRLFQNPGLPTVKSAVELKLSNIVEAAPP